ncbi:MAG: hypothetical protein HQM15_08260 [Deltaproteobacteria bacterium]|nr:hypothetical protein [Deltaproteobacteria bacterium]
MREIQGLRQSSTTTIAERIENVVREHSATLAQGRFLLNAAQESLKDLKHQIFNTLHQSLASHFSHSALQPALATVLDTLQQEVFTPEFAMELSLMTVSGAVGGLLGSALTSSLQNRTLAFGLRMALTHVVSSRANEGMHVFLGHTEEISGISLRDLGGVANLSSAEGINHVLQPLLRRFISNPLLSFAVGRVAGALTMMASSAVETKIGNMLGYSHEDWHSQFATGRAFTRSLTRSLALDVEFMVATQSRGEQ